MQVGQLVLQMQGLNLLSMIQIRKVLKILKKHLLVLNKKNMMIMYPPFDFFGPVGLAVPRKDNHKNHGVPSQDQGWFLVCGLTVAGLLMVFCKTDQQHG